MLHHAQMAADDLACLRGLLDVLVNHPMARA
jgi:hypothetical protein